MNIDDIKDKERIIIALAEHVEKTKSPHIFANYLRKQLNMQSGSRFHGLILELIQEGIIEYVQSNNQNTNIMFTWDGKEVAKISYSKYMNNIIEVRKQAESSKELEFKNQKFTYNWRYVFLIITILSIIIAAFAYFKPIK
jgi:hypothetical protein